MRILIPVVLLFSFFRLFAQKQYDSLIYFPKERVVHPACENIQNQDSCFSALLEGSIIAILNTREKRYKSDKDTLDLSLNFFVTDSGKALIKKYDQSISARSIKKKTRIRLQELITDLPVLTIENPKPEHYDVSHSFGFKFLLENSDVERFKALHQFDYDGGDIIEIPVFPGCEGLTANLAKECFNNKMQDHISKHFVYPDQAINLGISGVVKLMMTINEKGFIENIKTQGPHPILVQEAVRIINLVPRLTPGRINGKPHAIPYSIPITFRLN